MSETVISILVWLHVIGVAVWLGGQIVNRRLRQSPPSDPSATAPSGSTPWKASPKRFGRVGIAAMVVIVISGGAMIDPRLDQVENFGEDLYAARWGYIFVIKMALWAVMICADRPAPVRLRTAPTGTGPRDGQRRRGHPRTETSPPTHHHPLDLRPADDPAGRRRRSVPSATTTSPCCRPDRPMIPLAARPRSPSWPRSR